MAQIWDTLRSEQYIGLEPWAWIQFESAEPPGPLPFLGGVAPEVVTSLHEAHPVIERSRNGDQRCLSRRSSWMTPRPSVVGRRLCGVGQFTAASEPTHHVRAPGGWLVSLGISKRSDEVRHDDQHGSPHFSFGQTASDTIPVRTADGPAVGKFVGYLDGTYRVSEVRTVATALGRDVSRFITQLLEVLKKYDCLSSPPSLRSAPIGTPRSRIRMSFIWVTRRCCIVSANNACSSIPG